MRILLLNERLYPDSIGGVERRDYGLARALAARGHRVTLCGFGRGPADLPENVAVLSLGDLGTLYGRSAPRTAAQALRFALRSGRIDVRQYDVVEAANIPYIHLYLLSAVCRLRRVPLVVTWYEYWGAYWNDYVGRWRAPLYIAVEWMAARLGKIVNASSALTQLRLQRVRGGEVTLIPAGFERAENPIPEPDAPRIRGRLIFAGRLVREKRVELLLQAIALVPQELNPSLVIFGDNSGIEPLRLLAADLGIQQRIEFRGYVDDYAEVSRAMNAASIAVQPSSREGFGLFPLEAMAHELPVIYCQSSESAIPELVHDGVEGLCTDATPQSLADGISHLLRDDALRLRLAKNAGRRSAELEWTPLAVRFEAFLARCIPVRSADVEIVKASGAHSDF